MSNATILVVDDVAANIRLLAAVLELEGYTVAPAESGPAALERLAAGDIDLVLLDVQMPGMNGYEVCRRIREDDATAVVPVVMVTAAGDEQRVNAIEAGADDFIVRPLNQAELLARVRSLLRIKKYHDALAGQAEELAAFNRHLETAVQEQVEELTHLRRLRRFLSPQLAAAVESGDADRLLELHRAEVAVLFADLRGFTAFSASAEPEETQEVLLQFHALLGELVRDYGATVGFFAGDGVMFFFNDPLPCPDPARQAVLMAQELVARFAERHHHGERVGVGAGIAYGYATLGTFGFEGRWDYTAIGSVVNAASRLCDHATTGEVLLSDRAAEQLGDAALIEARGEMSLRGFPSPIRVWAASTSSGTRAAAAVEQRGTPAPSAVATDVEISILGPLMVRAFGREVDVRSAKERAVLVVLAAASGKVVSVERLAEELWEGDPPDSAVTSIRVYVSRLRKTLAAAGLEELLVTRAAGYELRVDADAIDAARFERLTSDGLAATRANDHATAVTLLQDAVQLWRGDALVDIATGPVARGQAARLEELRLTAYEGLLDAELARGEYGRVISDLEPLLAANPLREKFWAQRIVALASSGRQPEALRAYQDLRQRLADELGLEPSPAIVQLERAVATGTLEVVQPAR